MHSNRSIETPPVVRLQDLTPQGTPLASYVRHAYTRLMPEALKDTRWNLRVAPDANALVRQAASARHQNLTDFVVDAAVSEAERVLADRTRFVLGDDRWAEFVALLERPVQDNPGLAKLFARQSVFE